MIGIVTNSKQTLTVGAFISPTNRSLTRPLRRLNYREEKTEHREEHARAARKRGQNELFV